MGVVSAICTLALIVGVLGFATASLADGGVIVPPQPSNPWSYSQTTNIRNGNTGNVGIAIDDRPEAKLHVGKGADANAKEGGFLVLGQVSGKNLALDDNEIMARENGKPADLTLQAEGGNLIIQSFKSDRDSRVGIGNPKPLAPLSVSSPSTASDNSTLENFGVLIQSLGEETNKEVGLGFRIDNNQNSDRSPGGAITFERTGSDSEGSLRLKTKGSSAPADLKTRLTINSDGNVGIGTSSPGSLLTVNGVIETTNGGIKFPDGTTVKTKAELKGEDGKDGKNGMNGINGINGKDGALATLMVGCSEYSTYCGCANVKLNLNSPCTVSTLGNITPGVKEGVCSAARLDNGGGCCVCGL
jgi:hypothetical protein